MLGRLPLAEVEVARVRMLATPSVACASADMKFLLTLLRTHPHSSVDTPATRHVLADIRVERALHDALSFARVDDPEDAS